MARSEEYISATRRDRFAVARLPFALADAVVVCAKMHSCGFCGGSAYTLTMSSADDRHVQGTCSSIGSKNRVTSS